MSEPSATSLNHQPASQDAEGELDYPSPEELAALLPQYEVHGIVGVGGMGAVYRARQVSLDRWVAIKVLPSSSAQRPEDVQRFIKEARAMARLVHPHIVAVFDFGQTRAKHLYLVMEFIEGTDLHRLTRSGGVTEENAYRIVCELCEALQFAHDRGVAHRDIKPANILITKDLRVKVADFGLAREASAHTVSDEVEYGTPDYTAPERLIIGATADHRADIFSLGVVMHEMLTGKTPAAAGEEIYQGLPNGFSPVIEKCIQPEPEARYQKASEVRAALYAARFRKDAPASGDDRQATTADFQPKQPAPRAPVPQPQIQVEPPEKYTRYRAPRLAGIRRSLSALGWGLACLGLVAFFAWLLLKDRIRIEMPETEPSAEPQAVAAAGTAPPSALPPSSQSPAPDTQRTLSPTPVASPQPLGSVSAAPPAQVVRRAALEAPFSLEGPLGEVARLPGHDGQAHAVRLLAGGARAISIGTDGQVRLWDLAARRQVGGVQAGIGPLLRLQVTPDERKALIYGFAEDQLALVDIGEQRLLHQASFPNDRLIVAVYLPGQGQVIAGGATEDGTGNLYTWNPGEEVGFRPLEGFTGRVYAMTLMPDVRGVLVASSALLDPARRLFRPALTVVDGASRAMKSLPTGQLGYITRFMGAPGATTCFVLGGSPKLLRLPTLEVLASLPPLVQGQPSPLAGQAVDGGRLLLTSWSDGSLRVHECATAEEIWRQDTAQAITDIAIGPGERWAVLATRGPEARPATPGEGALLLWRLPSWAGMMGSAALAAKVRAQMADLPRHDPELSAQLTRLRQKAPLPDPTQHQQQRALLDSQYLAALRREMPAATPRDQPAFRQEMERVSRREDLPATDPTLIPALRGLRAIYAQQISQLQRQRADAIAEYRQALEDGLMPLLSRREKAADLLGAARVKSALEEARALLAD